jgi:hypothetical protein
MTRVFRAGGGGRVFNASAFNENQILFTELQLTEDEMIGWISMHTVDDWK